MSCRTSRLDLRQPIMPCSSGPAPYTILKGRFRSSRPIRKPPDASVLGSLEEAGAPHHTGLHFVRRDILELVLQLFPFMDPGRNTTHQDPLVQVPGRHSGGPLLLPGAGLGHRAAPHLKTPSSNRWSLRLPACSQYYAGVRLGSDTADPTANLLLPASVRPAPQQTAHFHPPRECAPIFRTISVPYGVP